MTHSSPNVTLIYAVPDAVLRNTCFRNTNKAFFSIKKKTDFKTTGRRDMLRAHTDANSWAGYWWLYCRSIGLRMIDELDSDFSVYAFFLLLLFDMTHVLLSAGIILFLSPSWKFERLENTARGRRQHCNRHRHGTHARRAANVEPGFDRYLSPCIGTCSGQTSFVFYD